MLISTLSSKNQITIPKDILLSFGIKSKDQLLIEKDEEKIILRPIKSSIIDGLAGSLTKKISKKKLKKDFKEIERQTRKKTAYKLVKKQ
jgi:AbrB family looped-hinge helix DNA binding protein